jgi:ABC-type transport system involved in cytochrome c biogenesis permease subunit
MKLEKIVPWVAGLLTLLGVLFAALPSRPVRGLDLDAFGRLPVLEGGRVKPIDSVARNSLLMIRGQQSLRHLGRTIGADEWLLDTMLKPAEAADQPVFVINDPDVLALIGKRISSDRYFSMRDVGPYIDELQRQAQVASQVDAKQRTRFQGAVLNLFERMELYYRLQNTLQLATGLPLAAEVGSRGQPGAAQRLGELAGLAIFRPLPPVAGEPGDHWRSVGEALQIPAGSQLDAALVPLAGLASGYVTGDSVAFNRSVAALRGFGAAVRPEAVRQGDHEILFNRTEPFYLGMVIYVLALLVLFASWGWKPDILRPTAFALLLAGSIVHTLGLVSRVILQGRPPVTNLYSSAVFVGWGAVVVGLVLERMYRKGFGTAVAAASGFASLIVAHHLAGDGDTMEMMRAVLDSNFWLATHVVTITIGYSGTFLAGAIGIAWTLRQHAARDLDPATTRTLGAMTYGVICFALFFSFIGTVLGGIWADQSWGRFWGWDPKENGALFIVL